MERKIVMVVDPIKQGLSKIDITRNDLEGNTANQTTRLISSLEKIARIYSFLLRVIYAGKCAEYLRQNVSSAKRPNALKNSHLGILQPNPDNILLAL